MVSIVVTTIKAAFFVTAINGVLAAAGNDPQQQVGPCYYLEGLDFPFDTYCNTKLFVRYTSGVASTTVCGKVSFDCPPDHSTMTGSITYYDSEKPGATSSQFTLEYKGRGLIEQRPVGDPKTVLNIYILSHDASIYGDKTLTYYVCSNQSANHNFSKKVILATDSVKDVTNELKLLHYSFRDGNLLAFPNDCPA